jgi:MFS family permease
VEEISPNRPVLLPEDIAKITFRAERIRSIFAGALEPAFGTFLLLIAVRNFNAAPSMKAWLVAGPSLGLMLGAFVVALADRLRWPPARAIAGVSGAGALCLLGAASTSEVGFFVTAGTLAGLCTTCATPLMTQVYQDNYPSARRGRLFSRAFVIRIACATGSSYAIGQWMTSRGQSTAAVLVFFAACAAASAFCWATVPSEPLQVGSLQRHPLRGFECVLEDGPFRRTLISWMLMGVGNLVMLPLRIELLARPQPSGMWTAAQIALLTAVVPNVARVCTSRFWGWAFDRMDFFALRGLLNGGFALAILAFFSGDSFLWMVVGAVLYGVSGAGGDVVWSLWVTKLAPPEKVADYMAVHTLLTGIRGVLAPVMAFHAVHRFSFETIGWFCACLIVLANVVLWPEMRFGRSRTVE